jgi:hypothetical protein
MCGDVCDPRSGFDVDDDRAREVDELTSVTPELTGLDKIEDTCPYVDYAQMQALQVSVCEFICVYVLMTSQTHYTHHTHTHTHTHAHTHTDTYTQTDTYTHTGHRVPHRSIACCHIRHSCVLHTWRTRSRTRFTRVCVLCG